MSEQPRSIWCVSDGRAGIERQTLAVAHALSEQIPVDIKVFRLTPNPPQLWLPPQVWPAPLAALPADQRAKLKAPWPDIWIGNGRRSIPYSLKVKRWSGDKSFIVQLQNPRVDPARFDLVVPPQHDQVTGENVVETFGAPVWFTQAQVDDAKATFPDVASLTKPRVLVILGGASKRHRFSLDIAQRLIADLNTLAGTGARLFITASRRTPESVIGLFRDFAKAHNANFFANEHLDGPNPYLAWLASADTALVTEDSTNMITDAAFFGLPIHLVKLEGGDAKFDALHQAFIEANAARWFQGQIDTWAYPPIRDAAHVARAIVSRLTSATT